MGRKYITLAPQVKICTYISCTCLFQNPVYSCRHGAHHFGQFPLFVLFHLKCVFKKISLMICIMLNCLQSVVLKLLREVLTLCEHVLHVEVSHSELGARHPGPREPRSPGSCPVTAPRGMGRCSRAPLE